MSSGTSDPPSGPSPSKWRPSWALPVLFLGVVCSLAVGWLSFEYARGQAADEAPTTAMVYMIWLLPLIGVGLPALAAGVFATSRPWSDRPWWLPWALVGASIAWFFLMVAGPGVLVPR